MESRPRRGGRSGRRSRRRSPESDMSAPRVWERGRLTTIGGGTPPSVERNHHAPLTRAGRTRSATAMTRGSATRSSNGDISVTSGHTQVPSETRSFMRGSSSSRDVFPTPHGAQSRGRGLHMAASAWMAARGRIGDGDDRQLGGLQRRYALTPHGGVGNVGRGRGRQPREAGSPRATSQNARSIGRGRGRTIPAWVTRPGHAGTEGIAPCQVRGLQHGPAPETYESAGNNGEGGSVHEAGIRSGDGGEPATEVRDDVGSRLEHESPPCMAGTCRRRSASLGSTSTRPRVRLRRFSPPPRRATEATAPTGILRRRRRSASLDVEISARPRQRLRVTFSSSIEGSPRQPRQGSTVSQRTHPPQRAEGTARGRSRGFLGNILRWIRPPFRHGILAETGQNSRLPQPAEGEGRRPPVVAPPAGVLEQAPIRRVTSSGGTAASAPPLPPRARAGAGVSRVNNVIETVNDALASTSRTRGGSQTPADIYGAGAATGRRGDERSRDRGRISAIRQGSTYWRVTDCAPAGPPRGQTARLARVSTRATPVETTSGLLTVRTGVGEGAVNMDVDPPQPGATVPAPPPSRTVLQTPDRVSAAGEHERMSFRPSPLSRDRVSAGTRSSARRAAIDPASAPPIVPRPMGVSDIADCQPRPFHASSASAAITPALTIPGRVGSELERGNPSGGSTPAPGSITTHAEVTPSGVPTPVITLTVTPTTITASTADRLVHTDAELPPSATPDQPLEDPTPSAAEEVPPADASTRPATEQQTTVTGGSGETLDLELEGEGRISTRTRSRTRQTVERRTDADRLVPPSGCTHGAQPDNRPSLLAFDAEAATPEPSGTTSPLDRESSLNGLSLSRDRMETPRGSPSSALRRETPTSIRHDDQVTTPLPAPPDSGGPDRQDCHPPLTSLTVSASLERRSPQEGQHSRTSNGIGEENSGPESRPAIPAVQQGGAGPEEAGTATESPRGVHEPSGHDRRQHSTSADATERTDEAPDCGICLGIVTEPSVSLAGCGHAMCLDCYARASVREAGDVLHCPMCRSETSISATSGSLRLRYGGDVVSEAVRVARSERDLVRSTATEASQTHEHRHICGVCLGPIGQGVTVSLHSCGCQYHTRCAVGLVEDELPNALQHGHDRIACPNQDGTGRHGFQAIDILLESDRRDSPESGDTRQTLDARIEMIRLQLQDAGLLQFHRLHAACGRTGTGSRTEICVICHHAAGRRRPFITAPCSCPVHLSCALTFAENHLISLTGSGGSRMVSCPNPALHDSRRDISWPRLLELVEIAISAQGIADGYRNDLQARVDRARERLQAMTGSQETQTRTTSVQPGEISGGTGAGGAGCCSYCGSSFGPAPHAQELAPVPVPCGHHGYVHANCLWQRADQLAHGRTDPQPCSTCAQDGVNGRRPPSPAELVQQGELPQAGGRWDILREQVALTSLLMNHFDAWSLSESGGGPVERFGSFDGMVRAHGRSPTASWLLVTLFCDVFDLNDVYMVFPRNWDASSGWDQMVQRYRAAFYANSIHPYQVLLELPSGRTYIAPHVQEYLAHLDPVCEEHLTFYTVAVHSALNRRGHPLPPFPQVGGVVQRHERWNEHYALLNQNSDLGHHVVPPTTGTQRQVTGVGVDPGYDIDSGPTEEDDEVPGHPERRSRSLGATRRYRSSPDSRASRAQNAAGLLAVRRQTAAVPPAGGNGHRRRQSEPTPGQPRGRGRPPASTSNEGSHGDGLGRSDTSGAEERPNRTREPERPVRNGTGRDVRQHPNSNTRCGGCSGQITEGHRVVELPCGHVIHARCVISNLERGGSRALLECRVAGCGIQHPRRNTLEAAVQADPGLQQRAERLIGGLTEAPGGERMLFNWTQDSPGIGPALDGVSMDDLTQRFETVKKVQPGLAQDHARIHTHILQLVNNQLAENSGPPSDTGTSSSTIRVIKLWYLLPALLHSSDGRITRKQRYHAMKRGDISSLLPWLIAYTQAARARSRGPAQEDTPDDKCKRAAQACRHSGGVKDAARALLAEPRSPGNEETWERLKAKFPDEDPVAVEEAIAEAITESRIEDEDGSASRWRPENEFDPQVLFAVISTRSSNSGAGNDGQRFSHLKSIVNTKIGREDFGTAMSSFWRRIINNPNAFPPEFWTLWKQSSLIALGEKRRPVCIGMTWRRLIAAGVVREWKPKLEEVFREADQFGVAVAGGVEKVAMHAQLVHQTGHWVIQTDCSNAFNTAKRTAIMAQAAKSTPDLVGYIARCYDEVPAKAVYEMDSGERRTIECKSGVQQGDGMGPPLFCFVLVPIVIKLNHKYEPLGVSLTAYMDDISLHFKEITATTIPVIQDLVDELQAAGIVVNRGKSSALPPPRHEVTHEERRLLGEAGLPIAEEGITVVGVPIGTDDFVKGFAEDVITKGGAGKLARMLARMPDKQVAHLITSMSLVQRSAYIERGIDHTLVSGACERLDNLVMGVLEAGMGLRNEDDEEQLFEEDGQPDRFKLRPYQQAQARLSTGAGGLGLPATVVRRFSASLGNLVSTLPAVIATLKGPLGESVKTKIPDTVLVERMGEALRKVHEEHGLSEGVLKGLAPPSWVAWALEQPGETGRRRPTVDELAAHDGESTTPRKAQHKLGKAINKKQLERFMESLEQLPQQAVPPTQENPCGGRESKNMALARVRSSQGKGAHAWLRAAPTDRAREFPPNEFVYAIRRTLGVEEFLATAGCPRCHRSRENNTITTVHARTCPRDGAQVNMHEPLKYALSRALTGLGVKHDVETGAPFTGERNLSMDIVIRQGALANASSSVYRHKGILLDVTHADPQAQVHIRNGSATSDGTAAQASEARKRQHYARPGHVSFDERSFKLTTLAVESFGRLGEEGYEFIDELATHAAGGRDGGTMAQKGVYKERLLQVVAVATQVAISRRVQRYKLTLRGRRETEDQRTRSTSNTSTPMIWGCSIDAQ